MKSRKLASALICAGLLSVAFTANASVFHVQNQTQLPLSFKINGTCSKEFGSIGVGETRVVTNGEFAAACHYTNETCVAEAFQSANCKGEHIATMTFEPNYGVKDVLFSVNNYAFTWRPYWLTITHTS